MRVLSINANKGLHVPSRRAALLRWLERHEPTLLLLQEPWRVGQEPVAALGELQFIAGNSNVAAYAARSGVVEVVRVDERWVALRVGGVSLHGLYFPADSGDAKRRAEFLWALRDAVLADPGDPNLLVGDFNMAPTAADGVYGDEPSRWTSAREREALAALLADGDLVDTTRDPTNADPFTFERLLRGKTSRFRCDLALASRISHSSGHVSVAVDHSVRVGPQAFTDHSALIIDLKVDDRRPAHAAAPSPLATAFATAHQRHVPAPTALRADNTAIRRGGASAPMMAFRAAHLREGMRVLDFGCGFGEDVEWLRAEGIDAVGYDPGPRFPAATRRRPPERFDAVTLLYVVNVLPPQERLRVLQEAWSRVKPGGMLFVAARPSSLGRNAQGKGWSPHEDGHWSDRRRGMFQKGYSTEALAELCGQLSGAEVRSAKLGSSAGFSAALAIKRAD